MISIETRRIAYTNWIHPCVGDEYEYYSVIKNENIISKKYFFLYLRIALYFGIY